jgi:predicted nuclease with TOPRIM domain
MSTLLTKSIESSIKTAISGATVGLHKKIETQEKEISDLKSESSQIKIENRRLNDNVFDLMVDIEELEQYGRRNSFRFHNVPITKEELNKTDDKIVDICKQHLKIDITPDDINRSHIIGKIHHEGSCQLICRFRNGKIKNQIFKQKKQLKSNANKIYITEDLTRYRQQLVSKIQIARKERKIYAFLRKHQTRGQK